MRNSQNPGSQEFWGRFVEKPRALSHAAAVKLSACHCKSCRQQQEVAYPFFHLERLGTSLHQPPGGFCAQSARENADNNLGNGGRRTLNVWLDASQGAEYVCVPEIPAPSWCLPPFNTASRPFSRFKKPLPGTPRRWLTLHFDETKPGLCDSCERSDHHSRLPSISPSLQVCTLSFCAAHP